MRILIVIALIFTLTGCECWDAIEKVKELEGKNKELLKKIEYVQKDNDILKKSLSKKGAIADAFERDGRILKSLISNNPEHQVNL